jgi:hypothetical protein
VDVKIHCVSRSPKGAPDPTGCLCLAESVSQHCSSSTPISANAQIHFISRKRMCCDQRPFDEAVGQALGQLAIAKTTCLRLRHIHNEGTHILPRCLTPSGASIAAIAAIHVQRVRIGSFDTLQKPSAFLH